MSDDGTKRAKSRGTKTARAKAGRSARFDQNLEALETLVAQLESGDLGLEEALKLFEKGVKLTRNCQQALDNAQQKVEMLVAESGIALSETDAVVGDEDFLSDIDLEGEGLDE